MKLYILLAISVLLIYPASAFAGAGDVTVDTDSSEYVKGDIITISGSIAGFGDVDLFGNLKLEVNDVTITIVDPSPTYVEIAQVTPSSDGTFTESIITDKWKKSGTYTITANYGKAGTASASFDFTIPDTEAIEEVTEAIEEVGEAIEAVSEEIVESVEEVIEAVVPGGLQCGSGTHADGGYCVADEQSFELETDPSSMTDLMLGASIVFGIAVAVIIALRLIGRASRN